MSYHVVDVQWAGGGVHQYRHVTDVNHWQSGLVELLFKDGSAKIISGFRSIDISAPMDEETNEPIQTITEG